MITSNDYNYNAMLTHTLTENNYQSSTGAATIMFQLGLHVGISFVKGLHVLNFR